MNHKQTEFMILEGANRLREKIQSWWADRGYIVKCRVEQIDIRDKNGALYVVRSDLGMYMPPCVRREAA